MVDEIAGRARRLSEEDGTNGPRTVAGSNGSPTISDSVLALATASTSAKQARGIPRNVQLDETAGTVTDVCAHGVVAADGVNVVNPSEYSVGNGIWK